MAGTTGGNQYAAEVDKMLEESINQAYDECCAYIGGYIASSVVANLVPLPGVGLAADVGLTVTMLTHFQSVFEAAIPPTEVVDKVIDKVVGKLQKKAKKMVKSKIKKKLTALMARKGVRKTLEKAISAATLKVAAMVTTKAVAAKMAQYAASTGVKTTTKWIPIVGSLIGGSIAAACMKSTGDEVAAEMKAAYAEMRTEMVNNIRSIDMEEVLE